MLYSYFFEWYMQQMFVLEEAKAKTDAAFSPYQLGWRQEPRLQTAPSKRLYSTTANIATYSLVYCI